MSDLVIGLYGCSCHPFKDWNDHDFFHKQKIEIGKEYIIRHTGEKCIVKGFEKEQRKYVKVFVEPYDCPRCNQTVHKSNLIKV